MAAVVALERARGRDRALGRLQRQGNPLEIAAVSVADADADAVAAWEREACADVASSTQPLLELS